MLNCPCCSNLMVRHFQDRQVRWFCRHCWSEMPILNSGKSEILRHLQQPGKWNTPRESLRRSRDRSKVCLRRLEEHLNESA